MPDLPDLDYHAIAAAFLVVATTFSGIGYILGRLEGRTR